MLRFRLNYNKESRTIKSRHALRLLDAEMPPFCLKSLRWSRPSNVEHREAGGRGNPARGLEEVRIGLTAACRLGAVPAFTNN